MKLAQVKGFVFVCVILFQDFPASQLKYAQYTYLTTMPVNPIGISVCISDRTQCFMLTLMWSRYSVSDRCIPTQIPHLFQTGELIFGSWCYIYIYIPAQFHYSVCSLSMNSFSFLIISEWSVQLERFYLKSALLCHCVRYLIRCEQCSCLTKLINMHTFFFFLLSFPVLL